MSKKPKNQRQAPKASKSGMASLYRTEKYAVLSLKLGQKIYQKLKQVEAAVEILARQKARELLSKQSGAKKD